MIASYRDMPRKSSNPLPFFAVFRGLRPERGALAAGGGGDLSDMPRCMVNFLTGIDDGQCNHCTQKPLRRVS
jgi:hypothetical protein